MTQAVGSPRVLVLGGAGMLGHKVWQVFRARFDTWVTVRAATLPSPALFSAERTITGIVANEPEAVARACDAVRPTAIVNCIGVVKQLKESSDPVRSITVNALFPHQVAVVARRAGARLVQISTDCVFSGTRGRYREDDTPDAADLYGRTKLLGETTAGGCLTVRTSIIGRELSAATGLVEWFLSHRGGRVKGYTGAWFSGLTTLAFAELLADIIERYPALEGLYHVASAPISKYDLLSQLNEHYGTNTQIDPSDDVHIDRTLDGSRFDAATDLRVPGWDEMIAAMVADPTPYDDWRQKRV